MTIKGTNNWIVITNQDGSKNAPVYLSEHDTLESNALSYDVITEEEARKLSEI